MNNINLIDVTRCKPSGLVLSFLAAAILVFPTNAAENSPTQGIGLSGAVVGGVGFAYRYFPSRGFGFHGALIGWDAGDDTFFDAAAEALYILDHRGTSALYLVGGGAWVVNNGKERWAGGAGLGFARQGFPILHTESLWTSYELVMTAFDNRLLPYPQIAVIYYFR